MAANTTRYVGVRNCMGCDVPGSKFSDIWREVRTLRVSSIDKMIEQLEALERVDGKSEHYKNQAIAYLKDFADHLDSKDIKTIKEKCPGAVTPVGHTENIPVKL